jgi:hypothetical protein
VQMGKISFLDAPKPGQRCLSSNFHHVLACMCRTGALCSKDKCTKAHSAKLAGIDFDYFPQVSHTACLWPSFFSSAENVKNLISFPCLPQVRKFIETMGNFPSLEREVVKTNSPMFYFYDKNGVKVRYGLVVTW